MPNQSLHFTSIGSLCGFIRTTGLRNFVLLGKKNVLIADLPEEATRLALQEYHADLVNVQETKDTLFSFQADKKPALVNQA